jgi:geranylgeranyl diphosphate synthase type II
MIFPEEAQRLRVGEAIGEALLGAENDLQRAMTHALLAGGKRLRPLLTCLWGERFGADPEDCLQAGLALEWLHTYSLVHDDLPCMDDDELRRGKPTVHKVFGEALAVLCGDALLTDAFGRLAALQNTEPERVLAALARLAKGAGSQGMVLGQVEDLAARARTCQAVLDVHHKKTGCLLRTASALGAILGGASADELERVERFASHLAIAFQALDDLLDATGNTESLGKPTGSDELRDLPTLVGLLGPIGCRALVEQESAAALAALDCQHPIEARLATLTRWMMDRDH